MELRRHMLFVVVMNFVKVVITFVILIVVVMIFVKVVMTFVILVIVVMIFVKVVITFVIVSSVITFVIAIVFAVGRHFKDVVTLFVRADSSEEGSDDSGIQRTRLRTVFTMSKEDYDGLQGKLREERIRSHEARLHASIGFRHVIDLISASGKLVVAHNSFLDLAHIHSKFIGPLPCHLKGFCAGIQRKFPRIADTKFLLKAEPRLRWSLGRKTTNLSKLYAQIVKRQRMQGRMHAPGGGSTGQQMQGSGDGSTGTKRPGLGRKVKVEFADGFTRYAGGVEQFYHEAGFDAYMTGVVFAQACTDLGVRPSELSAFGMSAANSGANESAGSGSHLSKGLRELSQYVNVVVAGWIGSMTVDISAGKEGVGQGRSLPEAGRSRFTHQSSGANVVLVWGFSQWLGSEVLHRTIGGIFSRPPPVQVFFVDPQSALVQFNKDATATTFLTLAEGCHNGGRDMTKGMQAFRDAGIQVAPFSFYRDLCSSPSVVTTLTDAAEALLRERRWQTHQTSAVVVAGNELEGDQGNEQETYKENSDQEGRHRHPKRPVNMFGSVERNPKRRVLEGDEAIDAVEQTATEMDPETVLRDADANINNSQDRGSCETGGSNDDDDDDEEEEEEDDDNNGGVKA
ncbi:hypothetical protein CBR_g84872 [Chara braunii]|uniref:Exonuclease domain-containing protein n=1 Tax=Chara braunii TaxID=69332 RepID=A0A388KAZ1_CHABU|nr:hypothetical protein CBR_g84872 [Chara braunii]|eukprot:GBG67209.1 hypothetical protein CBR_g84872 [Chara braunii]